MRFVQLQGLPRLKFYILKSFQTLWKLSNLGVLKVQSNDDATLASQYSGKYKLASKSHLVRTEFQSADAAPKNWRRFQKIPPRNHNSQHQLQRFRSNKLVPSICSGILWIWLKLEISHEKILKMYLFFPKNCRQNNRNCSWMLTVKRTNGRFAHSFKDLFS